MLLLFSFTVLLVVVPAPISPFYSSLKQNPTVMSFDLIEAAKSIFNSNIVSQASSQLGESEGGIQKALAGIIPVVLGGLLNKAGASGDSGGLLSMVKGVADQANPAAVSNAIQGGAGGLISKGTELLQQLFGDRVKPLIGMLSSYAGIKESSADALLQSAAPATLGTVGQYASENNLTPSTFLSFLNTQKDKILSAVPGGLNLAGILGLSSLGDLSNKFGSLVSGVGSSATPVVQEAVNRTKAGGSRWIWSLILILVAVVLLWYLMRGCGGNKNENLPVDSVTTSQLVDSATTPVVATPPSSRESIQVTLPDGTVLNAYKGGIEDQLVTFLKDDSKKAGKDVWFDFDNLNFKTGSAEITDESMTQVKNIAAILKAFPKAKIKIGGYTDKTGDSAVNLKLSTERAGAVDKALKQEGTKPDQLLGAEGYGSQFAKAAADAPEEQRKLDRHISVSVREK